MDVLKKLLHHYSKALTAIVVLALVALIFDLGARKLVTVQDYAALCTTISAADVEASPRSYRSSDIRLTGTIVESQKNGRACILQDEDGAYWRIIYKPSDNSRGGIPDCDGLILYGRCNGLKKNISDTYGSEKLPTLTCVYYEIADES